MDKIKLLAYAGFLLFFSCTESFRKTVELQTENFRPEIVAYATLDQTGRMELLIHESVKPEDYERVPRIDFSFDVESLAIENAHFVFFKNGEIILDTVVSSFKSTFMLPEFEANDEVYFQIEAPGFESIESAREKIPEPILLNIVDFTFDDEEEVLLLFERDNTMKSLENRFMYMEWEYSKFVNDSILNYFKDVEYNNDIFSNCNREIHELACVFSLSDTIEINDYLPIDAFENVNILVHSINENYYLHIEEYANIGDLDGVFSDPAPNRTNISNNMGSFEIRNTTSLRLK